MEKAEMSGSKRRSQLGIGVAANLKDANLGTIDVVGSGNRKVVVGSGKIVKSRHDVWKLLYRSKQLLSMRTVSQELIDKLDYREEWNQWRDIETVLDLFPSLKYSYSSLCGCRFSDCGTVKILSDGCRARIADIARSHSIRLDPVDSPKQLFKYRQRIQRIIDWSYANDLVPVMVTLTMFHRWQPLEALCRVLRNAWSDLFRRDGHKRKQYLDLRGYVRRMEETLNDGEDLSGTNAGWHPHYHVILIVPRENLQLLSEYEEKLRLVWVKLVSKYYKQEFGEEIPAAYYEAFKDHGLVLSRYKSEEHAVRCGNPFGVAGGVLEVHDSEYLAKVMGTDTPVYGGDSELTAGIQKYSKTPFEMLRGEVTANLADLWCEYALATKKIPCFTFSRGLEKEVAEYFKVHDTLELVGASVPKEKVVGEILPADYKRLYRMCKTGNLLEVANQGSEVLASWLKDSFDIDMVVGETVESDFVDGVVDSKVILVDELLVMACNVVVDVDVALSLKNARFVFNLWGIANNKSPPEENNKAPPDVTRWTGLLQKFYERRPDNGRNYDDSS